MPHSSKVTLAQQAGRSLKMNLWVTVLLKWMTKAILTEHLIALTLYLKASPLFLFQVYISSFPSLWSLNNMHLSCTELCCCSHYTPEHNCALLLHKKQKQQVWAFCHCHFTYFHLKCKLFFAWQRIRCVCHSGEGKNTSWKSHRVHSAHHAALLWAESHPSSADLRLIGEGGGGIFTWETKQKPLEKTPLLKIYREWRINKVSWSLPLETEWFAKGHGRRQSKGELSGHSLLAHLCYLLPSTTKVMINIWEAIGWKNRARKEGWLRGLVTGRPWKCFIDELKKHSAG